MSREKYAAREKVTQKMSRDGLVAHNAVSGEEKRISRREAEYDLRGGSAEPLNISSLGKKQSKRSKLPPRRDEQITDTAAAQTDSPSFEQSQNNSEILPQSDTAQTTDAPDATPQPEASYNALRSNPPNKKTVRQRFPQPTARNTSPDNPQLQGSTPDTMPKQSKLNFTQDESTPDSPKPSANRKLAKAEHQAERTGKKLEKARDNLPSKRRLGVVTTTDETSGKTQRKLQFEKTPKSQRDHIKGPVPLRPVKAGLNTAIVQAHRKIYQAEDENVGVKAAHRVETTLESGLRSALRYRKTAPYRKVAQLERTAAKKSVKLTYQKTLAENPKLRSNMFSRMWQKRKIKKNYAKAARDAKKKAQKAKKAAESTGRAVTRIVGAMFRHPVITLAVGAMALIMMMLFSMCGVGVSIMAGGVGDAFSSIYLAEDEDIDRAELAYTEWETDLLILVENAETNYPGYDEYRYNIGAVGHNPYVLMAYLTAMYADFTYDAIADNLAALFDEQYSLTLTPSAETRYRNVIIIDEVTGERRVERQPYNWRILTVTLTSSPLENVVASKMNAEQQGNFDLLMQTLGGRQYVGSPFAFDWTESLSSLYGYRVHPVYGDKRIHTGIDIAQPTGTEIVAAADGTVTFAGVDGGYGNVVVIEHANGISTRYAHCDSLLVSAGQSVNAGDVIATVGSTGVSTGAHLHFEVLKNGQQINPLYFSGGSQ